MSTGDIRIMASPSGKKWIENYPDEKLKKIDDVMISK